MHVVVIDDEKILSQGIRTQLMKHDYTVSLIASYTDFLQYNFLKKVDLFLVDMSLGDGSGIDIVKQLRLKEETANTPVIFISGHNDTHTKVSGLDAGGDDYIVKPFEPEELMARVRSALRKNSLHPSSSIINFHNICFNTASRKVTVEGNEVKLSRKEKQILEWFILHPETLISKDELVDKFWSNNTNFIIIDNTINVTICNVRKKIGDRFKLKTIVGEGYYLYK